MRLARPATSSPPTLWEEPMSEPPASPDAPRPSDAATPPPSQGNGETRRSAPAPAPSILDHVATRTGRVARVRLPDEGSAGAAFAWLLRPVVSSDDQVVQMAGHNR